MADVLLRNMPQELMRQVKADAALQGLSMKQYVVNALELAVGKSEGLKPTSTRRKPRKQ
jgi:hypothetical protein